MGQQSVVCSAPILGTVLRIIALDACGVPVTGTGNAQIVMDGFVQAQAAPQYDTGARKITRLASGALCHNFKLPDAYTNDQLTIDFCVWNPALIVNTIGGRLLTATQSPTGTGAAYGESATSLHASLEIWQAVDGVGACDPVTGLPVYLYNAWPNLADFKRGQSTIGNDPTQYQVIANSFRANPRWTAGAAWLGAGQIQSLDHWLWNATTTPPPASQCVQLSYP